MAQFKPFSQRVHTLIEQMSKGELYTVDVSGDKMWESYLAAFPEGTDPMFRERTEHDCSCCRNFIRNFANVVSIKDNKVTSIWDIKTDGLDHPYDVVSKKLSEIVHNAKIDGIYRTEQRKYGQESSNEVLENGTVRKWNHFYVDIANQHFNKEAATEKGKARSDFDVSLRSLEDIAVENVDITLELIKDNNLYRGEESKSALTNFKKVKQTFDKTKEEFKHNYVWSLIGSPSTRYHARIRNTAIGTMLLDIDEKGLEDAVKAFESMMAPTNYRRPKALVTKAMLEKAAKDVEQMGFSESLARRLAVMSDIDVNDVLWAGAEMQNAKISNAFTDLIEAADSKFDKNNVTQIDIDAFLKGVASKAGKLEVLMTSSLKNNLVTVTAPVNADSKGMFKWNNKFGWSYVGNITDSITERVSKAGGDINAKLRFSLAWDNSDDLDLHSITPHGHVYYGTKMGILDVDANAFTVVDNPVENQAFRDPINGSYEIRVNNFRMRNSSNQGYTLLVADPSGIREFSSTISPANQTSDTFKFTVKDGVATLVSAPKHVTHTGKVEETWNISTEKFINVRTVMNSPNHWGDNAEGHKHWFFVLSDCKIEEPMRGYYNEFLVDELREHRKTFELVASKTMCDVSDEQLSGVGFVKAREQSVFVRVDGKKVFKVTF